MSGVSIRDYDAAEQEGARGLSARQIQSFAPATFSALGYPTRVGDERELLRYVDVMHETNGTRYLAENSYYSDHESRLILATAEAVKQLTAGLGTAIRPWASLFASVPIYRLIHHISSDLGKKLSVFEIGPGSGYLGALLIQEGHRYAAMDNTQAFYLWQNRLYRHLCGNGLVDLAGSDGVAADHDAKVVHVPWWKFAAIRDIVPTTVDIVVCDQALGEMTSIALKFILRTARRLLAGDQLKLFLFTSIGRPQENSLEAIREEFFETGYSLISYGVYHAFVPPDNPFSAYGGASPNLLSSSLFGTVARRRQRRRAAGKIPVTLLRPNTIEPIGPAKLAATAFFPLRAEEAPLDYEFLARSGFAVPLFPSH